MIGLGSYAYFWQQSDRAPEPLSLIGAFEDTRAHGVGLFQICDYAPLEQMSDAEVREAAMVARALNLTIELGTTGIGRERLSRFLALADRFDARLVRSMIAAPDSRRGLADAESRLRGTISDFEAADVTLALETYEQVATTDLVTLIERIGSSNLGICLDPANVVARLEQPEACVRQAAPHVANVHAKDFVFARQDGWVGFTYSGAPMGAGLHDYEHLLRVVHPRQRDINEIVEHWLPWQADAAQTIRTEREWTRIALDFLRSTA